MGEADPGAGLAQIPQPIDHHQMAVLRLDIAAVAGLQPAVAQAAAVGQVVVVVAGEHAGGAGDDFADPIAIRVFDPHFGAGEGQADGFEVDILRGMNGVGAAEFGLAIELAQRYADGAEEAEGVGTEQRPGGGGGAQPGETEAIAQGAGQQQGGQVGLAPLPDGGLPGQLHAHMVELELEGRGIHQPGIDVGGDRLPDPGSQQQEVRPDFPQVAHHGFVLFHEMHDGPRHQRLGHGIDLLHDPGQRQYRNIMIPHLPRVGRQVVETMGQQRPGLQHRQFRRGGGAGGRAENGDIAALAGGDQFGVTVGSLLQSGCPGLLQLLQAEQQGVVVLAHPPGVAIDDAANARAVVADLQQFVDLLLVLGDDHPGLGDVDQKDEFLGQGILIETDAQRPEGVGGDLAEDPAWAAVADQADHIAALDRQGLQPQGDQPDLLLVVGPGDVVPDAEALFPHGDLGRPFLGVVGQQFGEGVVTGDIGVARIRVAHDTALSSSPLAAGVSAAGSSTTSSPR